MHAEVSIIRYLAPIKEAGAERTHRFMVCSQPTQNQDQTFPLDGELEVHSGVPYQGGLRREQGQPRTSPGQAQGVQPSWLGEM